jgi:hypothetical protein
MRIVWREAACLASAHTFVLLSPTLVAIAIFKALFQTHSGVDQGC